MQLSDRIAVMFRGRIVDVIPAKKANKQQVGLLMAGVNSKGKTTVKKKRK
jgi:simple sugar transport system ATP-binding protein